MNKAMTNIADAVSEKRSFKSKLYSVKVRDNGHVEVLYRDTLVAVVTSRNVLLNTGGWYTATTLKVINAALTGAGANARVSQRAFQWEVRRFDPETFQTLSVCTFIPFDRFSLALPIKGRGTLTEAEQAYRESLVIHEERGR